MRWRNECLGEFGLKKENLWQISFFRLMLNRVLNGVKAGLKQQEINGLVAASSNFLL